MKPEQLYQHLKDLAEKLSISVSEQSFRKTSGIRVKSGLCKVKGQYIFVMDKRLSIQTKINELATCLANMPHENLYVIPAVRDLLDKNI
ncbi:hypothetical protein ACFL9U_09805 [Thermodesulfobacteriota bacterium]